ncbi:hypothetical protein N657DRAFT_645503 [Parathielavia appendiculata]|uniref:Uncharacterized protein n=1 Tax=Parathielavia appendiculata TaxID=2587402 RepID=A0AAN6U0E6_9PEZI|nr:hypothetical protein N657DRAFT_645503 [Parathielavia appendiculata]
MYCGGTSVRRYLMNWCCGGFAVLLHAASISPPHPKTSSNSATQAHSSVPNAPSAPQKNYLNLQESRKGYSTSPTLGPTTIQRIDARASRV